MNEISSSPPLNPTRKWVFGMVQRRACFLPTARGWIFLLVLLATLSFLTVRSLYPFLAMNQPVPAQVMVVEGWAPKYALEQAVQAFNHGHYQTLLVTGGQIEEGSLFSDYGSYANLGGTILRKMGFPEEHLQIVAAPLVKKDRTYASAVCLKEWMSTHGGIPSSFNVVSLGTHSRRTHLLFESAFQKQSQIGIIPVRNRDFDPAQWWHYSQGVRSIIDEAVAYFYARFLFCSGCL